jgi:putative ABC transport system permease protein
MKKRAYFKDVFRELKKSLGRFIAILSLVAIGTGFFVGIKAAAPSFKKQAADYFKQYNLMDYKIQSALGLTEEDMQAVQNIDEVKDVALGYTLDVTASNNGTGQVYTVYSILEDNSINTLSVKEGRMPKADNECLVNASSEYTIGDTITFDKFAGDIDLSDSLKNLSFTVVGKVDMPNYFAIDYGRSSLGNGTVNGYVLLTENAFNLSSYTVMYVTLKCHDNGINIFTDSYENIIDSVTEKLDEVGTTRYSQNYNEKIKLLEEAKEELSATIEPMGLSYADIDALDRDNSDFKKLIDAKTEIEENKLEIEQVKDENWYIFNRSEIIPYYASVSGDADTIDGMSAVFPVIFLLVVALVCTTTMSRMIEEQRIQIGTYKALGYSTKSIMMKYLTYAGLASGIGGILGTAVFVQIIPRAVSSIFKMLYNFPEFKLVIPWDMMVIALIVAVVCTVVVTWFSCKHELSTQAAQLMRAKAPKAGKKILIERIECIWNRLNFSYKITLRNLFRYKGRLAMTLFGVAGCTALIISAFALLDAVSPVVDLQYNEVQCYDLSIAFSKGKDVEEIEKFRQDTILTDDRINEAVFFNQSIISLKSEEENLGDVYLLIPEDNTAFKNVINTEDVLTNAELELSQNGVIITQKAADLLGVTAGDKLTLIYDNIEYEVNITGVTKNYIVHYVYMDKDLFSSIIGEDVKFTTAFIKVKDSDVNTMALSESLLKNDDVVSNSVIQQLKDTTAKSLSGMNGMIIMMIFSAGLLSFIVVYNLTNINIQERKREIATIKVLGFKHKETNMYIFRENIIMMIFGIIIGLVPGRLMGTIMVSMCEADATLLYHHINNQSYLYAVIITVFFNVVVNLIMLRKVKSVDMIESLKAIE